MTFKTASLSLVGHRKENQDRVAVLRRDDSLLLIVVDGMGGHSHGANAAQLTVDTIRHCFGNSRAAMLDPQGFLTIALSLAHDAVVGLGAHLPLDQRPRATCAVCVVQDNRSFWAHVGDSRIYQLRDGEVVARTRDHSHIELLLREGVIQENQMSSHPMRNLVECCLGGDSPLPEGSVSGSRLLEPGDTLIVCTDGLWSGVDDFTLAAVATDPTIDLDAALEELAETAVANSAPHSDNTSLCALRCADGTP